MGSRGSYLKEGGFNRYDWKELPNRIEGIKVVLPKDTGKALNLPYYSRTPATAYLKVEDGKFSQLRKYKDDRSPEFDIDFGQHHTKEPYLHVHYYTNGIRNRTPVALKPGDKLYEEYKTTFIGVI